MYFPWAMACFLVLLPILRGLRKSALVGKTMEAIIFACQRALPFVFVIIINAIMFSVVATYILGGIINSKSRERYLELAGSELPAGYEYLNWNDLLNSLVYLYSINIKN